MSTVSPGGGTHPSPGIFVSLQDRAWSWLQLGLTVTGIVCLGVWTAVTAWAHLSAAHNEALLERAISSAPALRSTPLRPPATGALLGRLDIPRAGVSAIVLEGTTASVLAQAAGHVPGTALPGETGNIVLAAHRDSLFRGLQAIAPGDAVTLLTPGGTRLYEVRSTAVVRPDDTSVLVARGVPSLTLITCFPFTYVGAAPERFVVVAEARGGPAPATPGMLASLAAPRATTPSPPSTSAGTLPRAPRPSRRHASGASSDRPHPKAGAAPRPAKRLRWWQRLFGHRSASSAPRSN
jgi:LPXTG-site transpeptidase (sortase) family protein